MEGKIEMSLESYEELKSFKDKYDELLDQITNKPDVKILIADSVFFASNKYWMKGCDPENLLLQKVKEMEASLKTINNKKVPIFNFPGTKVKNLQ